MHKIHLKEKTETFDVNPWYRVCQELMLTSSFPPFSHWRMILVKCELFLPTVYTY